MTTALLPRGSRFGDLRLTGFVGSGGFSDVYEAYDKLGRRLAVKVIRLGGISERDQQERINREQAALRRIDSRGVARLITADLTCETPWIASEFVDGPTIRESISERGPLSQRETLSVIRRLAEILDEIHAQGIAHRDITPNNVIFSADGPVLIDFGSAKIDLESHSSGSVLVAGTMGYLPPEVERNEPVGRSGDIYSLARVAQFCLSGSDDATAVLPSQLKDALDPIPGKRPSADEIVQALADFIEPVARHELRDIVRLPRRYRPRALAGASLASGLVALGLSLSLAGPDEPLTSKELLVNNGELFAGDSWTDGLFLVDALPDSWTAERLRPIDSLFGHKVGDLDAFQVRFGDVENQPEGSDWAYGQMKVGYRTSEFIGADVGNRGELPDDLDEFSDYLIDLLELSFVENGCVFRRADTTFSPFEGRHIWAAEVVNCGENSERRLLAGLMWDDSSELIAQWILDTNFDGASSVFPNSVSVPRNFDLRPLGEAQSWSELTNLGSSIARIGLTRSAESPITIPYGIAGVEIPPGEAVEVENLTNSEPQVSFFLVPKDGFLYSNDWVPSGRWWARQPGEKRIVGNSTAEPMLLYVEAEEIWDDNSIALSFRPTQADAQPMSLHDALGDEFKEFVTPESENSDQEFQLPVNPPTSTDSSTSTMEFRLGEFEVSVETELAGASISDETLTFVTRADDTIYDWELSYFEPHNPHFMVTYAPAAELLFSSETTDWLSYGRDVSDCSTLVNWEIKRKDAVLNISGKLGCLIADTYFYSVSSITHQTNPIFKFSLGSISDEDQVIAGSFAPASSEELVRFQRFLTELIERSEEILIDNPMG